MSVCDLVCVSSSTFVEYVHIGDFNSRYRCDMYDVRLRCIVRLYVCHSPTRLLHVSVNDVKHVPCLHWAFSWELSIQFLCNYVPKYTKVDLFGRPGNYSRSMNWTITVTPGDGGIVASGYMGV